MHGVCGDGSVPAPQGRAPRGWYGSRSKDRAQSTQSEDCSRGDVPGRVPSWLQLLWAPPGWALSLQRHGEAGTRVSFSPLTAAPLSEELERAPAAALGHLGSPLQKQKPVQLPWGSARTGTGTQLGGIKALPGRPHCPCACTALHLGCSDASLQGSGSTLGRRAQTSTPGPTQPALTWV